MLWFVVAWYGMGGVVSECQRRKLDLRLVRRRFEAFAMLGLDLGALPWSLVGGILSMEG